MSSFVQLMVTKVSRASAQILAFNMYDKTSQKVMNFSHLLGCDTDVSVNSKSDHPPGVSRDSYVLTASVGQCFAQLSLPGRSGFRIRDIYYSFERNLRELLDLFQRNRRRLFKAGVLVLFHINFCKNSRSLLYL